MHLFRKSLVILSLLYLGVVSALAQAVRFEVVDSSTGLALSAFPNLISGVPFNVRVTALDENDAVITTYNRPVTLRLRAEFGQVTEVSVPAGSFVDGVLEQEITPRHAMTARIEYDANGFPHVVGARISVTDANIITDNASGFFSIAPAGFRVTYSGSDFSLANNKKTANETYLGRVTALNDDGTTASGYRGAVRIGNRPVTSLDSITVLNPGSGYDLTTPPTVSIVGGGPGASGATAVATVGGQISVAVINVTEGGRNYTDEPGVELRGGGGSGARAQAVVENGIIVAIVVTNGGAGYTSAPEVIITDEEDAGTGATAVALIGGQITGIELTDPGTGYTLAPRVVIGPQIAGALGQAAQASIVTTRGNGLALSSINLIAGGSGYDPLSPPSVEIVGGGGTGATATAVVDDTGVIVDITLDSAGADYTSAPSIVITDPAGVGSGAIAVAGFDLALVQTVANITFGGVVDQIPLSMGEADVGLVYDATDGIAFTLGASDEYDITLRGGGAALDVDEAIIFNGGDAAGAGTTVRYRLINNTDPERRVSGPIDTLFTLVSGNVELLRWSERTTELSLDPGDTTGNQFTSFILPYNMTPGSYTIRVDPGYSAANRGTIGVTLGNPPDLEITQFNYAPGQYQGGDAFRFDLTWQNSSFVVPGTALTSAVGANQQYMIEVHLSTNPTYGDEDDFLVWQETFVGNGNQAFTTGATEVVGFLGGMLLPGQQVDVTRYAKLPENFAGTYYLLARVNSAGGRNGTGFTPENIPGVVLVFGGNNTIQALESQKITILPKQATDTFRVSLSTAGAESTGLSDNAAITRDGKYVAFESLGQLDANPVLAGITNVYIRNVDGSATTLVSQATGTAAANGHSANPEISANGRYVVFQSGASNLVPGDSNGVNDIFVRDVQLGITRRLSTNRVSGVQGNNGSQLPSISADGRYVVFESKATNLTTDSVPTGVSQIYLHDRDADADGIFDESGASATSTILVTKVGGVASSFASERPRISGDGNYVVFVTRATTILGQSAPYTQIVRWDKQSDVFAAVTRSLIDTDNLADNESAFPAINADGSYVAFVSRAHNLTEDLYEEAIPHVFRAHFDSGVLSEVIRLNSRGGDQDEPNNPLTEQFFAPDLGSYEPSISDDGTLVTFASESNDLLPAIPVKSIDRTTFETRFVYNYFDANFAADVYLYDLTDTDAPVISRTSISRFGYEATWWTTTAGLVNLHPPVSRRPMISGDGNYIAFTSDAKGHSGVIFGATNFDYTATNDPRDIYVYDRKASLPVSLDMPEVSLLTPAITELSVGQTFTFVADASSAVRGIASVEFYANNSLIGTDTTPSTEDVTRYSVNWTAPSPGAGNTTTLQYQIAAIAVDSNGLRSPLSNVVDVFVSQVSGVAPTATITNPVATTTGEGDTAVTTPAVLPVGSAVPIVIRVVQGNSSIASVNVYASSQATGSVLLGTASALGDGIYQLAYTNSLAVGTYSLVAVVEDLAGNTVTSPAVALNVTTVSTGAPSITLATPFPSAILQGQSTLLNATASAAFGRSVSRVEFFSNGVSMGTATQSPYVLSYTPTSTGTFSIIAVVTDSSNATAISGAQSVTVTSVVGSAPTVVLTATDQLTLGIGSRVTFAAKVTAGNSSIVSVRFYANSTLLGTGTLIDGSTTYQLTYVNALPTGSYNVYAEATDANGNIVQSASRSVTSIAVEPPSVRIVTPIAGTYNILDNSAFERASARVNTQVTNDVFFGDKTITDIVVTEAGLNYAAGVVAYIEVRNDPAFGGGVSRTEPLEVTLAEDGSITALEFANEGDGAARLFFYQSAVVVIEDNFDLESIAIVAAPSSSSSIQELRYYANGVLIGSLSNAPYSLDWRPSRAGTYVLQVEITDEDGLTSSSPTVTVVINPAEDIAEPEILAAIEAAYQSILDRTPTTTEVRAYVERFGDNLTAGAVAASLLQSAEYRDDNAELILIYLAVWGEYPDISQFETLRAQRELALTDVQVVDAILASVSYTQRFGAIADLSDTLIPEQYKKIRAFALRTYKNMYGKDATGATANVVAQQFFTDIVTNALTPGQAVVNFVNENFNGGKNGTLLTRLRIAGAILLIGRVEPTPALITTLSPVPLAVIADFYFNDGEAVAAGTMIALETASGDEEAGTTFHASGLPKGLVMDVNTGVISGRIPGTLKAYVFTYWTQLNGVRSASRSVMVLVEALPTPLVGKYEALLEDSLGLPAGKISVTVAKTASLSGVVYYGDGKNYSFSGVLRVFDDGSASGVNSVGNPIVIKRKSPLLPISPALSFDAEGLLTVAIAEQISVTEDGDPVFGEVLSTGTALRPFTFTKSAPAPWRGAKKINLLNASFPETDGIAGSGTFTVASTGVLSVKAKGTDNAVLTGSAPSALDSSSVLYIRPYSKMTSGYFAGWFKAASEESIANASYPTDENEIYWFRPAGGTGTYSEGFGPLSIKVELAP